MGSTKHDWGTKHACAAAAAAAGRGVGDAWARPVGVELEDTFDDDDDDGDDDPPGSSLQGGGSLVHWCKFEV